MADLITCPKCGKSKPNNPKVAGKNIQCPGCKTNFVAPAGIAKPVASKEEIADPVIVPKKTKKYLVPVIVIGVLIIATGIIGLMIGRTVSPTVRDATSFESIQAAIEKPISFIETKKPSVDTTAQEIYDEYLGSQYGKNIASADAKYLDKLIRVRGKVLKIEKNGNKYWVGFETGPNVIPTGNLLGAPGSSYMNSNVTVLKAGLVAEVSDSFREAVAKINDMDTITIVGLCTGKKVESGRMGKMLVLLTGATIESHEPFVYPKLPEQNTTPDTKPRNKKKN